MRGSLAVLMLGAVVWAGCAVETGPGFRRGGAARASAETPAAAEVSAPSTAACASVPAAISLAEGIAKDVRIAGSAVFYQSGTKVLRVGLGGSDKATVYTSPDLVSSYVDTDALLAVETTGNDPSATLRVVSASVTGKGPVPAPFPEFPAEGAAAATAFNAAGTRVFASDAASFYVLADTVAGDAIVKVSKADPNVQTTLVAGDNVVITTPQLANGSVWYVRDAQHIFKVAVTDAVPAELPKQVFAITYASCSLAVSETAAFCGMSSGLERRDLEGGSPAMILDAERSKTQARFGATLSAQGSIYVRSESSDERAFHVIRAVSAAGSTVAEEKLVACGRGAVTGLAVGASHVIWTEATGGVYAAAR